MIVGRLCQTRIFRFLRFTETPYNDWTLSVRRFLILDAPRLLALLD